MSNSWKDLTVYQRFIRPILFQVDPEYIHNLTLKALSISGEIKLLRNLLSKYFDASNDTDLSVDVFGLRFPNPLGLAAGYEKNCLSHRVFSALGFGHIEIGTVTPFPQKGNPKPRIFRIPEENAVINRMGFPGKGMEAVRQRLSPSRLPDINIILGVNIGKNKDTPIEDAAQDYVYLFEKFFDIADYLSVNVSSPNTVGLRRLQARDLLEKLLFQLKVAREKSGAFIPILLKVSPDLSETELFDIVETILRTDMDGIIVGNTTVNRYNIRSIKREEVGGLSGSPITKINRQSVARIFKETGGKLPIIGVGGIMTPEHAMAMLDAGASLIQVYTGLIYAGPQLVRNILQIL